VAYREPGRFRSVVFVPLLRLDSIPYLVEVLVISADGVAKMKTRMKMNEKYRIGGMPPGREANFRRPS